MKTRTEGVLAALAVALLSPLVCYAPRGAVPMAGMVAVASGIALSLMLAGRRLHDAMLTDALGRGGGRRGAAALVLSLLAVILLVLFAIVFCVWILLRRREGGLLPGF